MESRHALYAIIPVNTSPAVPGCVGGMVTDFLRKEEVRSPDLYYYYYHQGLWLIDRSGPADLYNKNVFMEFLFCR